MSRRWSEISEGDGSMVVAQSGPMEAERLASDFRVTAGDLERSAELRWWYQDARGEMGLKSAFEAMVLVIQCPRAKAYTTTWDADARMVNAASRAEVITRALARISENEEDTLHVCYSAPPCLALSKVFGDVAGLLPVMPATIEAYQESHTARLLPDWLERLARPNAPAHQRLLSAKLVNEARDRLRAAARSYNNARFETDDHRKALRRQRFAIGRSERLAAQDRGEVREARPVDADEAPAEVLAPEWIPKEREVQAWKREPALSGRDARQAEEERLVAELLGGAV